MKTLEQRLKAKSLRKQHNQNSLTQYSKLMKYCIEVGFDYKEAKRYVPTMLRVRR